MRIGLIGNRFTAAIATEWWRRLTRRNRILTLTPLMFSSMFYSGRKWIPGLKRFGSQRGWFAVRIARRR